VTSPEAEFEEQVEEAVTAEFVTALGVAGVAVLTAWLNAQAAGLGFAAVRELAVQLFSGIRPDMRRRLAEVLQRPGAPLIIRDDALSTVVAQIDRRAQQQLDRATRLARRAPMDTLQQASVVVAAARKAGTRARADTRWAATRAVSLDVAVRADQAGAEIIWVPERNACLSCLAYAGFHVKPGELFPAGLTYGKTPANRQAVPFPPLHPNCRCRIEGWFGEESYAEALKREAQRNVARGFSEFASTPAKVEAARKLITRRTRLPKTVRARAARDVQAGAFSSRHNRQVPDVAPGRRPR
jgi:hypothetical protein